MYFLLGYFLYDNIYLPPHNDTDLHLKQLAHTNGQEFTLQSWPQTELLKLIAFSILQLLNLYYKENTKI